MIKSLVENPITKGIIGDSGGVEENGITYRFDLNVSVSSTCMGSIQFFNQARITLGPRAQDYQAMA